MDSMQYPIKENYSMKDKINMTTTALKEHASLRDVNDVAFLSEKYGEGILDYAKNNIDMNDLLKMYSPSLEFVKDNKLMNDNEKRRIILRNYSQRDFDDYITLVNEYTKDFNGGVPSEQDMRSIILAAKDFSRSKNMDLSLCGKNLIEAFEKEISAWRLWDTVLQEVNLPLDYVYNNRDNFFVYSKQDSQYVLNYMDDKYGTIEYMKSYLEKGDGTSDFYKNGKPILQELNNAELKIGDVIYHTQHYQINNDINIVGKDLTIDNIIVDENGEKHYHASVEEWDFYEDRCYKTEADFTEEDFYKMVFPNKSYYEEHYLNNTKENMEIDDDCLQEDEEALEL